MTSRIFRLSVLVVIMGALTGASLPRQKSKKEVSPEMMAIRKVYITGLNLGQVEWAYKNFGEQGQLCEKPVSTPEEADAILRIDPAFKNEEESSGKYETPIWVNCQSSRNSTSCLDSAGYESDTSCSTDRRGNVSCTSTYGPSMAAAVLDVLRSAARGSFVIVSLYTKDGKSQIWHSEDSTLIHTWAYDLSKHVGCAQQKCPATHFKPCDTRWYDPAQLGPDGKLLKRSE